VEYSVKSNERAMFYNSKTITRFRRIKLYVYVYNNMFDADFKLVNMSLFKSLLIKNANYTCMMRIK
jgi:hypothetical protein